MSTAESRASSQRRLKGDESSQRLFWPLSAVFSVVFVFFVVWMAVGFGGSVVTDNLDDFGIGAAALGACGACLFRSTRSAGRARLAWGCLAASAGSWAVGEFVYSVIALHSTVVTPSAADIGYLAAVPLGLLGIVFLAAPGQNASSIARAFSDGVIVAGSLLVISWTTALGSAFASSSTSELGRVVNLAYPISDVIMAAIALSLLSNWQGGRKAALVLVIASELCFAFGDSLYAYLTAKADFNYADVLDSFWVAAFFLLALASVANGSKRRLTDFTPARQNRWLVGVPYVAVCAALAAEITSGVSSDHLHSFLVIVGVVVLLSVISRQVFVIVNNLHLNAQLESAVERLQEREERLLHYALHDPLTGLANRLVLDDRLQEALVDIEGRVTPLAVLLVDLDRFKKINDTLGHSTGDAVLRAVALRLRDCVRNDDVIVRTGGDEFAILIDNRSGFADVEEIAEAVVRLVGAPITVDENELVVYSSVGIAVAQPGSYSAEALLRDADVALYAAKNSGGNTYRLFDNTISKVFFERLDLQSDLASAVEQGQFSVFYQPIIDMRTSEIAGIEALLRWNHPRRGVLAPGSFVRMAEESGLVVPIGRWVLCEALTQIGRWRQELRGAGRLWVSVNVSARQLLADDLNRLVGEALEQNGIPPDALHIELTESAFIDRSKSTLDLFQSTRDLGVELTIDDFGTGYSSLAYLHRMPVGTLKIDREFISNLDRDQGATKIIEAVIALAHTLDLRVLAEGVESRAQLARLIELGCEFAQGYLLCEPLSASNFEAWWSSGLSVDFTGAMPRWINPVQAQDAPVN